MIGPDPAPIVDEVRRALATERERGWDDGVDETLEALRRLRPGEDGRRLARQVREELDRLHRPR